MKNRITIGISSIVLIFMILCLAVFSLLSLSDAKSALTFAGKHADTVQIYYEADAQAQKFLRDYRKSYADTKNAADTVASVSASLPQDSRIAFGESGTVICEIPMRSEQTLYLELGSDGTDILSYYVYNSVDYAIDSDLPVWGRN